jgi:hypothetical protein
MSSEITLESLSEQIKALEAKLDKALEKKKPGSTIPEDEKCKYIKQDGSRCPKRQKENGYCTTHAHSKHAIAAVKNSVPDNNFAAKKMIENLESENKGVAKEDSQGRKYMVAKGNEDDKTILLHLDKQGCCIGYFEEEDGESLPVTDEIREIMEKYKVVEAAKKEEKKSKPLEKTTEEKKKTKTPEKKSKELTKEEKDDEETTVEEKSPEEKKAIKAPEKKITEKKTVEEKKTPEKKTKAVEEKKTKVVEEKKVKAPEKKPEEKKTVPKEKTPVEKKSIKESSIQEKEDNEEEEDENEEEEEDANTSDDEDEAPTLEDAE